VGGGAPELLLLHVLPDGRLHEVRPRQKHRAGVLYDDGLVAHNGQIGPAGHAAPHDGRNLRNALARQLRVVAEDAAEVVLVRENFVLHRQVHARRVDEVDDGHMVLQRNFLCAEVFLSRNRKPGPRLHGGVVRHDHALLAANGPQPHDRPPCRASPFVLVHLVPGKQAQLPKRRRVVDQVLDPLAGRELAPLVLAFNLFRPAPHPHLRGAVLHRFDEGLVVGRLLLKRSAFNGGFGAECTGVRHAARNFADDKMSVMLLPN